MPSHKEVHLKRKSIQSFDKSTRTPAHTSISLPPTLTLCQEKLFKRDWKDLFCAGWLGGSGEPCHQPLGQSPRPGACRSLHHDHYHFLLIHHQTHEQAVLSRSEAVLIIVAKISTYAFWGQNSADEDKLQASFSSEWIGSSKREFSVGYHCLQIVRSPKSLKFHDV